MKKLFALFCVVAVCHGYAIEGTKVFQAGLQAFQANGPEALFNAWYDSEDETARIAEIRGRFARVTQKLGRVVDTQVFAPRNLGNHVQHLYGVIYFERRPLWVRAECYSIAGRGGFISLEFSLISGDILPLAWSTAQE